jgi:PHD/YefM family antitoxin component YafN of YafNO toxin-antitoxin module
MSTQTVKGEEIMTDFQAKMLIEMIKDIVRELKDPEKIIERLDQIKRGESGDSQKD